MSVLEEGEIIRRRPPWREGAVLSSYCEVECMVGAVIDRKGRNAATVNLLRARTEELRSL